MSDFNIPSTNDPAVAAISTSWLLASQTPPDIGVDTLEDKLTRFVNAYEIIAKLVNLPCNPDEARARLKKITGE